MAKRLTVRQQVEKLRKEGHVVKTYERSDGGIRVLSVDGMEFGRNSSKGNDMVRKLTGQSLSRAQRKQRRKANRAGLSVSESEFVRRANVELRKRQRKPIRRREVAKAKRRYGWKEAKAKIGNVLRHSLGLAYQANVDYWVEALRRMGWDALADRLEKNREQIPDRRLRDMIELLYRMHNGQVSEHEAERLAGSIVFQGIREGKELMAGIRKAEGRKAKKEG